MLVFPVSNSCCIADGRVHQEKSDVKYSDNGTVVDYHEARHMEFVPHLSCGNETDTVTVPNIPAVVCILTVMFYDMLRVSHSKSNSVNAR